MAASKTVPAVCLFKLYSIRFIICTLEKNAAHNILFLTANIEIEQMFNYVCAVHVWVILQRLQHLQEKLLKPQ